MEAYRRHGLMYRFRIDGASAMRLTPCVYLQPSQVFEQHGETFLQGGKCY